ncbi:MAG: hypothetical protein JXA42_01390 [Anaerolineales bacterium]|nr:hypothetical protein [Anaerolineales bacterium]
MKKRILGVTCFFITIILAACGFLPTPIPITQTTTLIYRTPIPITPTSQPVTRTEKCPSPLASSTTTCKPLTVTCSVTPGQTQSPSPIPELSQTKTSIPTTPPSELTPIEPTQSPAGSTILSLPLLSTVLATPGGEPDVPLFGVTALAVDPYAPDGLMIAAGTNEYGVLISRNGGQDWSWSVDGLPANAAIWSVTMANGEIIALVEDRGAYFSSNGDTWAAIPGLSNAVESVAFSPTYQADSIVFAVQNGALLRSTDRGASWAEVLPNNSCPLNVTFSPDYAADNKVYAPRCDVIASSTDGGQTWTTNALEQEPLLLGHLSFLVATPDGSLVAQGRTQSLPVISRDGGRHWEPAYVPAQAQFRLGSLLGPVRISAGGAWYLAGNLFMYDQWMRIWRSTDQGQNWYEVAHTTAVVDFDLVGDTIWVGTWDGIYSGTAAGWQLVHPGGNRPVMVDITQPAPIAITRQSGGKYTSWLRVFEKHQDSWQPVMETTSNYTPLRAFPSPNYDVDRFVLLLSQDYGGQIHAMTLNLDETEPLVEIEMVPVGKGDSIDQYRVQYAPDYRQSGRIELVHGSTGALYYSPDRGASWIRPDLAEPGACQRNPVSGFGALWFSNLLVRNRLLCPLEDELPYAGTIQPFEHGELVWLDPITTPYYDTWAYVFVPDLNGQLVWNSLPVYELDEALPEPPENFIATAPIFTAAWLNGACCQPDFQPIPNVLGWAVKEAAPVEIALQRFEGGTMIWRGDRDEIMVLVRTVDGDTYTVYPD